MADAGNKASGWEEHEREQFRAWLVLTYEQRLAWLVQAKEFAARAVGAAMPVEPR